MSTSSVLHLCTGVRRTRLRTVFLLSACFRIHSYVIRWCCSPGYFAPYPLGKFCQELKFVCLDLKLENPGILSSANPWLNLPRTLSSARFVDWKFPRTLESSAISCPTHLVTCLHRVFFVCETCLPWPVRDSGLVVYLLPSWRLRSDRNSISIWSRLSSHCHSIDRTTGRMRRVNVSLALDFLQCEFASEVPLRKAIHVPGDWVPFDHVREICRVRICDPPRHGACHDEAVVAKDHSSMQSSKHSALDTCRDWYPPRKLG